MQAICSTDPTGLLPHLRRTWRRCFPSERAEQLLVDPPEAAIRQDCHAVPLPELPRQGRDDRLDSWKEYGSPARAIGRLDEVGFRQPRGLRDLAGQVGGRDIDLVGGHEGACEV